MKTKLEKAKELLESGGYTFAAVSESDEITRSERGVKPLLIIYESGLSLKGYSAADKVIGKAAALMYVLLSPECIYAGTISRPALEVLERNNIRTEYGVLTEAIRNRTDTGFCPMESAVRDTDDPHEGLTLIKAKLAELAGAVPELAGAVRNKS